MDRNSLGSGPRTTLAGDANADIMTLIIECVREGIERGMHIYGQSQGASRRTSQ